MGDIALSLSKSIKEAKWLSIDYQNKEGEITSYWCAIIDIDPSSRKLTINAFNISKIGNSNKGVLTNAFLFFDRIIRADVLDHTTYERPESLINMIEENSQELSWLKFDLFNEKILNYIKECIKYDSVPYQKETALITAIDEDTLKKTREIGYYDLSLKQLAEITEKIEKIGKQDKERVFRTTELAINMLSISTKQGLFVCAYKNILLDPSERKLVLEDGIQFNYEFASDENESYRHNLRNYLDLEIDEFTELFKKKPKKAKEMLIPALAKFHEDLDDRPYIMDLVRSYNAYIDKEFESIAEDKNLNQLSIPLKAFFGNMDISYLSRKRAFDIVLLDDKMNVDQLRVIHNALKQPVTYVQGPPGTGKTQSIINLVISAFFNEQTVLISSNNNKPIDDIYVKLSNIKSKNSIIPFPMLRLGNNSKVKDSIEIIKQFIVQAESFESDDTKLSRIGLSNKNSMKDINEIIENYENRLELEEEIDALSSMLKEISSELRSSVVIQGELEKKQKELDTIPIYKDEEIHQHVVKVNDSFLMWLFFTSIKHIKRLKEPKYKEFIDIINLENQDEQVRLFNQYLRDKEHLSILQKVFPIIMTTNQSAYRLGQPEPNFDLTVIDEAGQCSIGHALFPMIRGKRLLLVGDQNQLRPVITLSPETNSRLMRKHQIGSNYHYVDTSIIKLMQSVDSVSKFILLRYHYRCHKDIIEFSNRKYYHKKLIIPERVGFDQQALFFLDINQKRSSRSNERNTSLVEINAIIEDIKSKPKESVGIITPFRNQADLIRERIKDENLTNVDVGTVHTFQGDEKHTIYMTTAITSKSSPKTFDWVKNNDELLNVATTRAKKEFIMVGDFKEIKKRTRRKNDLYELAEYVKKNGKEVFLSEVEGNEYVNSMNYRQYNTSKEKELLTTVNHILSFGNKYVIGKQVKVTDILRRYTNPELFDYGTKAVFDFVIYQKMKNDDIPRLVIELDGDEHRNNPNVIEKDKMKEKICKENKIELIRIPNNYTRRYIFIKDVLSKLIT